MAPVPPARMARAVDAYVTAHTHNIPVGLPLAIPLPAKFRWLTAMVGAYGTGYGVIYYAVHHPYPMNASRNPTMPRGAPVVLQMTGNSPLTPLPTGAVARLDWFWGALPLGPAPGDRRVGNGDPVPIQLANGVCAVEYRNWGDAIQWTRGSWTIVALAGSPGIGMQTANRVNQLLAEAPLPNFTGLIVVSTPTSAQAPGTFATDMAWVRGPDLYTLQDGEVETRPGGTVFGMVRALQWSHP